MCGPTFIEGKCLKKMHNKWKIGKCDLILQMFPLQRKIHCATFLNALFKEELLWELGLIASDESIQGNFTVDESWGT